MASVLLDSGVMVAIFATHEPHTERYIRLVEQAASERWHLSTTWPCVVEASHLLKAVNRFAMLRWIAEGAASVFPFQQEALTDFLPLMERYTQEPRSEMDLADASLVWLAQETGVTRIMTTDHRDFSRYRLLDGRGFEIL
jgi:uncharacterized protein